MSKESSDFDDLQHLEQLSQEAELLAKKDEIIKLEEEIVERQAREKKWPTDYARIADNFLRIATLKSELNLDYAKELEEAKKNAEEIKEYITQVRSYLQIIETKARLGENYQQEIQEVKTIGRSQKDRYYQARIFCDIAETLARLKINPMGALHYDIESYFEETGRAEAIERMVRSTIEYIREVIKISPEQMEKWSDDYRWGDFKREWRK